MFHDGVQSHYIQVEKGAPEDWWNSWRVHSSTRDKIRETQVKEESKTQTQNHPIEYATLGNLWYLFDHTANLFKDLLTDPKRIHDFLSYIQELNDPDCRGRLAHQHSSAPSFDDVKRTIKKSLDIMSLIPSKYHDTSGLGRHNNLTESISTAWDKVCQEEETYQYFNFPYQLKTFVGRGSDIERIQQSILEHRLVTLLGIGGIGKTSIAIYAIKRAPTQELMTMFSDGFVFVSLERAQANYNAILQEIIRVFGGVTKKLSDERTLIDFLKSKHYLLLLDNWETVQSPDAGAFLYRLLRETLYLHILVTSQQRVGIEGMERVQPLDPMAIVGDLENLDAYRLFLERACSNAPDWQPYDIDALQKVLELTDGIPLLIELVAARAHERTLSRLAQELQESRLNTLRRRAESIQTDPERHSSVEACFEWTYQLLSSEVKDFFPALCVFAGSFMSEAAAAVSLVKNAEPYLDSLRDASLVQFDTQTGRYSLLPIVKEYALKKAQDNSVTYRELYIEFFTNIAMKYKDKWFYELSSEELQTLSADNDNFRNALYIARDLNLSELSEIYEQALLNTLTINLQSILTDTYIELDYIQEQELSYEQKEMMAVQLRRLHEALNRAINKLDTQTEQ
jgi:predicted ATPase